MIWLLEKQGIALIIKAHMLGGRFEIYKQFYVFYACDIVIAVISMCVSVYVSLLILLVLHFKI